MRTWIFLSSSILIFLTSLSAEAIPRPDTDWALLRSKSFDLIFDAKNQDLAQFYAQRITAAINKVNPLFSDHPEKLLIVLNDSTDLPNGYASPFPYAHTVLFPVLPGPFESISEYGQWEEELAIHEYAHILSFEPQNGAMKLLRYGFGSIINPQMLLPRWWLEGLAVELETQLSTKGRLRSPLQDATARALYLDEKLLSVGIDEINETSIPYFPYGGRPYLYGSWIWSYIVHEGSQTAVDDLTQVYGGRIPYLIDGAAQNYLGKSYNSIFEETKKDLSLRINTQMDLLKKISLSEGRDLGFLDQETWLPTLSPDGLKLGLISRDSTLKRNIKILARQKTNEPFEAKHETTSFKELLNLSTEERPPLPDAPPTGTINRIAWFPDSRAFVYDLVSEVSPYAQVSDLWVYSLDSAKNQQLTQNLRAREPAISSDGSYVAFVKLSAAKTQLAILDLQSKSHKILVDLPFGKRISSPSFWGNDRIFFLLRENGINKIMLYNLAEENYSEFDKIKMPLDEISTSNEGVLAVSHQSGVPNLYFFPYSNFYPLALTHTSTAIGIGSFDFKEQKIYAPELTSRGWQIKLIEPKFLAPQSIPFVYPLLADRYEAHKHPLNTPEASELELEFELQKYNGASYLLPQYWVPTGVLFTPEKKYFAISTSGFDPIQHHSYTFQAGYEFNYKDYFATISYLNQQFKWPTQLLLYAEKKNSSPLQSQSSRNLFLVKSNHFTWDWIKHSYLSFGLEGEDRSYESLFSKKWGPSLSWTLNPLGQSGSMISPESGTYFKIEAQHFWKHRDLTSYNLLYTLTQHHQRFSWMPKHHSWMLRVQGQWTPENIPFSEYETSSSLNLYQAPPFPVWLLRGVLSNSFMGKSLLSTNIEYRFPALEVYSGSGLLPVFIKRFHGAIIADGIQLDGIASENALTYKRRPKWESFWTIGLELKADLTLGYHLPATLYLGVYNPLDSKYQKVAEPLVIGLQIPQ